MIIYLKPGITDFNVSKIFQHDSDNCILDPTYGNIGSPLTIAPGLLIDDYCVHSELIDVY